MLRNALIAAAGALALPVAANAAVFVVGTSNATAPSANPEIALIQGNTTTLYLWGAPSNPSANPAGLVGVGLRMLESQSAGGDVSGSNFAWIETNANGTDRWGTSQLPDYNPNATTLFGRTDTATSGLGDARAFSVGSIPISGTALQLLGSFNVKAEKTGTVDLFLGLGVGRVGESPAYNTTQFGFGDATFSAASPTPIGTTSAVRDARITITPVPEPTTFGLLGLGGLGLLARRRRSV